jgi:hypothetical protein
VPHDRQVQQRREICLGQSNSGHGHGHWLPVTRVFDKAEIGRRSSWGESRYGRHHPGDGAGDWRQYPCSHRSLRCSNTGFRVSQTQAWHGRGRDFAGAALRALFSNMPARWQRSTAFSLQKPVTTSEKQHHDLDGLACRRVSAASRPRSCIPALSPFAIELMLYSVWHAFCDYA